MESVYVDHVAQMAYGNGAIQVPGKVVVNGGFAGPGAGEAGVRITGLWGGIATPVNSPPVANDMEMWECEIVLIPKRKYSSDGSSFRGYRADQMLTGGYGNPAMWGPLVFEAE